MKTNVHITPVNDSKPHVLHPSCPCSPYQGEDTCVWIHNAWDGREFHEEPDEDEIELLRHGAEIPRQLTAASPAPAGEEEAR